MNKTIYYLPHNKLQELINCLKEHKYNCIGPQVRDYAVVYDVINSSDQLPWGYTAIQEPGHYRLKKLSCSQAFAWAVATQSIKPFLFMPEEIIWEATRDDDGRLVFKDQNQARESLAIIGARPCDLAGIAVQNKVFVNGEYVDNNYKSTLERLFIIVVNCTFSATNCFCASMKTGPKAMSGFDLAFSELEDGFVVEIGTDSGESIVKSIDLSAATSEQQSSAQDKLEESARSQTKEIPNVNLNEKLFANLHHDRWKNVADRCLSCANCTQVCPTCFCHKEFDDADLNGEKSEHVKQWASCFSMEHSYIHGEIIREDTLTRYRQWLTHKFGSWHDQFNTSGCVGCGRCITWCPAEIDVTEELAVICKEEV